MRDEDRAEGLSRKPSRPGFGRRDDERDRDRLDSRDDKRDRYDRTERNDKYRGDDGYADGRGGHRRSRDRDHDADPRSRDRGRDFNSDYDQERPREYRDPTPRDRHLNDHKLERGTRDKDPPHVSDPPKSVTDGPPSSNATPKNQSDPPRGVANPALGENRGSNDAGGGLPTKPKRQRRFQEKPPEPTVRSHVDTGAINFAEMVYGKGAGGTDVDGGGRKGGEDKGPARG